MPFDYGIVLDSLFIRHEYRGTGDEQWKGKNTNPLREGQCFYEPDR